MMTDALTSNDLVEGFREVGLKPGDVVLAHSAMRTFGPIDGGADAVIDALRRSGVTHLDMPATPERVWRALRGE